MTIIEVLAQNVISQYIACFVTHWPNRIGQYYQPCGHCLGDAYL
jgi:hypothetical protein